MGERVCLVHYHEIGLKGKNRPAFERQLVANLGRALRAFPVSGVRRAFGRLIVSTEDGRASSGLARAIVQVGTPCPRTLPLARGRLRSGILNNDLS